MTAALQLARVTEAPPTTTTSVTLDNDEDGANLFNLGRTPQILAYAVRGGNLTLCDYLRDDCGLDSNKGNRAVWVPIGTNIASLKAQYGRDTDTTADGIVNDYDQAAPVAQADWLRIRALRLALVARSAEYESAIDATTGQRVCDPVTPNAPSWEGSATAPVDLSGFADWKCYRYKVFQTVVPIRNIIWMGISA